MADRLTGIKGVRGAQTKSAVDIVNLMRVAPHNYSPEMITDTEMLRVAAFVRSGQHDADRHIDRKTRTVLGDPVRGANLYQSTCAACHGHDRRALNWGTPQAPSYVGTEAKELPWEVLHKIRNSHPGAAMINFRALPIKDSVDVLTYARTRPEK